MLQHYAEICQEVLASARFRLLKQSLSLTMIAFLMFVVEKQSRLQIDSADQCKPMLAVTVHSYLQACSQRAGVKFLKHNVRDEFDDVTDIARLYRIKNVPCFVFFSGGAMVSS